MRTLLIVFEYRYAYNSIDLHSPGFSTYQNHSEREMEKNFVKICIGKWWATAKSEKE